MVTVATGYQNYQGFPLGNTPVVDGQGNLTLPWARFLISLWQRAGTNGTLQEAFYLQQIGSQIYIINAATGAEQALLGTVSSVGLVFDGGIVAVAGSPVSSVGAFTLTVSGTSGGVPYFSSGSTWQSSPVLGQYQLMLGGGAGASPSTPLGLGTGFTVLHGNSVGEPSWGAVALNADVTGVLPVANGGTGQAGGYTVATLPSGQLQGTRSWVTNAAAASYAVGATVTAAVSGGYVIPVFFNGSAWVAG